MECIFLPDYPVKLDKDSSFVFNGFRLNGELFGDIRSIHGRIGGFEFDKKILKKLIMDFLTFSNNVELVNILSRELNKFNYFEIYSEKSEVKNIELSNVIGNFEVSVITGSRFIDSVKGKSKNGLLSSEQVISHIHGGIELFKPLNFEKLDFYPIWWINGSRNNPKCELFCHFSVMIHLLSKVFVEFKSQILQLAGVDIQIANETNMNVEDYSKMRRSTLIDICSKQHVQIIELTKTVNKQTEMIMVMRNDLNNQTQIIAEQKEYIDTLINMQTDSNNTLHRVEETVNDTKTELRLVSNSLNTAKNDLNDALRSSQIIANELARQTIENHSTETIEFTLMFFRSSQVPKSDEYKAEANERQIWIGCACGELQNLMRTTPSDKRIIFQRIVNSRDSCKFIYKRLKRYIIKANYRHILIEIDRLEEFFNEVDRLMDEQGVHDSIRNLESVEIQVMERTDEIERNRLRDQVANRDEQRASQLERHKRELLDEFGETLYISIAGYRRKVYFQQNGDWTIRFGRGGVQTRKLGNDEILNGRFGRNGDGRIHYE